MPRTDDDRVKAVMAPGGDYDLRRNPSLTPFITAASLIVTRLVARAGGDPDVDDVDDESALEVETWLAAHYYKCSDKGFSSKSTKDASASYQGQTGKGLDATFYGQTAKQLDPSGLLASVMNEEGSTLKPTGFWAGSPRDRPPVG